MILTGRKKRGIESRRRQIACKPIKTSVPTGKLSIGKKGASISLARPVRILYRPVRLKGKPDYKVAPDCDPTMW
jgi:hypothetical protein